MMQYEESDDTWSYLFNQLKHRGLKGTALIISDAHKGLVSAIRKSLQMQAGKMPISFFTSYLELYLKKELITV